MRFPFYLFIFLSALSTAQAQERCGTVVYEETRNSGSTLKKKAQFEQWIQNKTFQRLLKSSQRTQTTSYTIPVVVHVIHNGESIGTGTNISEAQIQSQIDVLNEDYQRLNADATDTPAEFQSVAGSMNIQFVLAKRDPFGVTSNGIVRVKGTKSSWRLNDEITFKGLSYWRADWYLNLWVINFNSSEGYIGYAQFPSPEGTSLDGLEGNDTDSLTDGVVIHYKAFGSGTFDLETQFNRGRTATHEIGHYFGLRHIWGDDSNCSSTTDYVSDTPKQNTSTNGCPSNPQTSCSNQKMFQNYLDYTNDECMNLFTQGQIDRMDIVINNSPRRKSLLTSPGTIPSTSLPLLDIEMVRLKSPGPVICLTNPTPELTIKNSGNTVITSFKVETIINNGSAVNQSFTNIQLLPSEEKDFSLSPITLNIGANSNQFTLKDPNGQSDNTNNNLLKVNVVVNQSTDIIPLRQNFNNDFTSWAVVSPDGGPLWIAATTNFSKSLEYPAFTNTGTGQQSWLVSPTLDLSKQTKASVLFDLSYAIRSSTALERFQVLSSEDCGLTYDKILLDQQGGEFSVQNSATSWLPSKSTEWQKQFISLDELVGKENIRLAFVVTNQNGNNFYLDNFDFYEDDNSSPPEVANSYYIYGADSKMEDYKITFNLEERADVSVYVYNTMGQKIAQHEFSNVLNQTYPIDLISNQTGIYILRLQIGGELFSNKIFLAK